MKPIYVRTDKNGTRIFHDYTCPRCGGAGRSDKWAFTGYLCYECGGSGKRTKPTIIKEYTEEYAAKLDARRKAKAAERAAAAAKNAEDHADEIAAENQKILESRYAEFGCGKDGIGYVLTGSTFKARDRIRKNGGRWIYGVWVCPVEIIEDGISSKRITLNGHVGTGSQIWLDDFDLYDELRS